MSHEHKETSNSVLNEILSKFPAIWKTYAVIVIHLLVEQATAILQRIERRRLLGQLVDVCIKLEPFEKQLSPHLSSAESKANKELEIAIKKILAESKSDTELNHQEWEVIVDCLHQHYMGEALMKSTNLQGNVRSFDRQSEVNRFNSRFKEYIQQIKLVIEKFIRDEQGLDANKKPSSKWIYVSTIKESSPWHDVYIKAPVDIVSGTTTKLEELELQDESAVVEFRVFRRLLTDKEKQEILSNQSQN